MSVRGVLEVLHQMVLENINHEHFHLNKCIKSTLMATPLGWYGTDIHSISYPCLLFLYVEFGYFWTIFLYTEFGYLFLYVEFEYLLHVDISVLNMQN